MSFVLTAKLQLQPPGNLSQVVNQIQKQLNGITANVTLQVNSQGIQQIANLNKNLSKVKQNAQQATDTITDFGAQSALAFKRFFAFNIATSAFIRFVGAVKSSIDSAIEFNKSMVQLSQITGKSVDSLGSLEKEITNLSKSLGVSSMELTNISKIIAQAGFTADETSVALRSLAKASLAPSFDDMNNTVEGSIALMKQFNISADGLEKALSSINQVSKQFAVEAEDITTAVRRAGGAFAAAGGNLDEFISLFTSVRQTTRESAESIATGLRTIFTRMQRLSTVSFMKNMGIDLQNLQGQFVGPYEAVRRLSEALKDIPTTDPRFAQIIEELGGFRQVSKVIPLIQQFSTAQRALNVSLTGQNSLTEDAAKAQESLANKFAKVREEFVAMIRKFSENKALQMLVDLALKLSSSLIKVMESLEPLTPMLMAFGTLAVGRFGTQFMKGFTSKMKFASGGVVPGVGNSDSVPAMLTPGEFVMRKSAVNAIGAARLHRMNKYASGGLVRKYTQGTPNGVEPLNDMDMRSQEIMRRWNEDPTFRDNFNKAAKFQNSRPQQAAVVNFLSKPSNFKVADDLLKQHEANLSYDLKDMYVVGMYPEGMRFDETAKIGKKNIKVHGRTLLKEYDRMSEIIEGNARNALEASGQTVASLFNAQYNSSNAQKYTSSQSKMGSIYGPLFEGVLSSLGAPFIDLERHGFSAEKTKGIDFPGGLGDAGRFFGLTAAETSGKLVDAKRTIKAGMAKDVAEQANRFLANIPTQHYATGGMVESNAIMRKEAEGYLPYRMGDIRRRRRRALDKNGNLIPQAAYYAARRTERFGKRFGLRFATGGLVDPSDEELMSVLGLSAAQLKKRRKNVVQSQSILQDYYKALSAPKEAMPDVSSIKPVEQAVPIAPPKISKGNRVVGYLDGDVLADPRYASTVQPAMVKAGIKNLADYHKYLGAMASQARAGGSITKFKSIFGVPGSGKSTMMLGGSRASEADNATLRKTTRVPILTPEDINRVSEIIDTRASTVGTLNELQGGYLSNVDRMIAISSTTKEERAEIMRRRKFRDQQILAGTSATGFGRKAGTSTGAQLDSAVVEAMALHTLGPKKFGSFGVRPDFKLHRKTGKELPLVEQRKIGLAYGAFSPTTVGHLSMMNEQAAKAGISPEDFVVAISREGGTLDPKDPHSFRTAIFDQELRARIAAASFTGANITKADPSLFAGRIPNIFDVGEKEGQRRFIVAKKGSTAFLGDDKDERSAEMYTKAGYKVDIGGRTKGVSGTDAREAIMSGDMERMQKLFAPGALGLVSSIQSQIQNRASILPKILERTEAKVGSKLVPIEEELAKYPARLTPKIKEEHPEYVAAVEALRRQRDEIKGLKQKLPTQLLRRLGKMFPQKYGYAEGGVADTVPAMLTPGEFVFTKESAQRIGYNNLKRMNSVKGYAKGGVVQNFAGGGTAMPSTNTMFGGAAGTLLMLNGVFSTLSDTLGSVTQSLAGFATQVVVFNSMAEQGSEIIKKFAPNIKSLSQVMSEKTVKSGTGGRFSTIQEARIRTADAFRGEMANVKQTRRKDINTQATQLADTEFQNKYQSKGGTGIFTRKMLKQDYDFRVNAAKTLNPGMSDKDARALANKQMKSFHGFDYQQSSRDYADMMRRNIKGTTTQLTQQQYQAKYGSSLQEDVNRTKALERRAKIMGQLGEMAPAAIGAAGTMIGGALSEYGSARIQKGDKSGVGLAAAGSALNMGAQGAAIGAMFGPLGMVVGGATGALYGFVTGLKKAEAELNKVAFDKSFKSLNQSLEDALGGKSTALAQTGNVNNQIADIQKQLRGAGGVELSKELKQSSASLGEFITKLAEGSTNFDSFISANQNIVNFLGTISDVPLSQFTAALKKQIEAQKKAADSMLAMREVHDKFAARIGALSSLNMAIDQVAISLGQFDNYIAQITSGGTARFQDVGMAQSLANIQSLGGTAEFENQAKTRFGNTDLTKELVNTGKAINLVPDALLAAYKTAPLSPEGQIDTFVNQFSDMGSEVQNTLRNFIDEQMLGGQATPEKFLATYRSDPTGTAKKLQESLGYLVETFTKQDKLLSEHNTKVQALYGERQKLIEEENATLFKRIDINSQYAATMAELTNKPLTLEDFNKTERQRKQVALGPDSGMNAVQVSAAYIETQAKIKETVNKMSSASKKEQEGLGKQLDELQQSSGRYKKYLDMLSDATSRGVGVMNELAKIKAKRDFQSSILQKATFAGSVGDIRSLSTDVASSMMLGRFGNIDMIHPQLRQGALSMLQSMPQNESFGILGGKTPADVIKGVMTNFAKTTLKMGDEDAAKFAGAMATTEEQKLYNDLKKINEDANIALHAFGTDFRNGITDMTNVIEVQNANFLASLERIMLESQQSKLKTEQQNNELRQGDIAKNTAAMADIYRKFNLNIEDPNSKKTADLIRNNLSNMADLNDTIDLNQYMSTLGAFQKDISDMTVQGVAANFNPMGPSQKELEDQVKREEKRVNDFKQKMGLAAAPTSVADLAQAYKDRVAGMTGGKIVDGKMTGGNQTLIDDIGNIIRTSLVNTGNDNNLSMIDFRTSAQAFDKAMKDYGLKITTAQGKMGNLQDQFFGSTVDPATKQMNLSRMGLVSRRKRENETESTFDSYTKLFTAAGNKSYVDLTTEYKKLSDSNAILTTALVDLRRSIDGLPAQKPIPPTTRTAPGEPPAIPEAGHAKGGLIAGSGNRDSVRARLTPGEFVMRKEAVKAIGADRLYKMNKYADGDLVKKYDEAFNSMSAEARDYAVSTINSQIAAENKRKVDNSIKEESLPSIVVKPKTQQEMDLAELDDIRAKDMAYAKEKTQTFSMPYEKYELYNKYQLEQSRIRASRRGIIQARAGATEAEMSGQIVDMGLQTPEEKAKFRYEYTRQKIKDSSAAGGFMNVGDKPESNKAPASTTIDTALGPAEIVRPAPKAVAPMPAKPEIYQKPLTKAEEEAELDMAEFRSLERRKEKLDRDAQYAFAPYLTKEENDRNFEAGVNERTLILRRRQELAEKYGATDAMSPLYSDDPNVREQAIRDYAKSQSSTASSTTETAPPIDVKSKAETSLPAIPEATSPLSYREMRQREIAKGKADRMADTTKDEYGFTYADRYAALKDPKIAAEQRAARNKQRHENKMATDPDYAARYAEFHRTPEEKAAQRAEDRRQREKALLETDPEAYARLKETPEQAAERRSREQAERVDKYFKMDAGAREFRDTWTSGINAGYQRESKRRVLEGRAYRKFRRQYRAIDRESFNIIHSQGWAGGGHVPGTGNTDSVAAWLMPGEFVMKKSAVDAIGVDALRRMNKYAEGGTVGGYYDSAAGKALQRSTRAKDGSQSGGISSNSLTKLDSIINKLSKALEIIPSQITHTGNFNVNVTFTNEKGLSNAVAAGLSDEIVKIVKSEINKDKVASANYQGRQFNPRGEQLA